MTARSLQQEVNLSRRACRVAQQSCSGSRHTSDCDGGVNEENCNNMGAKTNRNRNGPLSSIIIENESDRKIRQKFLVDENNILMMKKKTKKMVKNSQFLNVRNFSECQSDLFNLSSINLVVRTVKNKVKNGVRFVNCSSTSVNRMSVVLVLLGIILSCSSHVYARPNLSASAKDDVSIIYK